MASPQTVTTIDRARTLHYYEYLLEKQPDQIQETPVVFIGPHKQVFRALDSQAYPRVEALLGSYTWEQGSGANFSISPESVQYDIPGVSPGASMLDATVYARYGNNSRVLKTLRSPDSEVLLAEDAEASSVLSPASSFNGRDFTLRDTKVNFHRLLRNGDYVYPSNEAEKGGDKWLLVRLTNIPGGPFYVSAQPSNADPYKLVLSSLSYLPIYGNRNVSYELVSSPREYTLHNGPLHAEAQFVSLSRQQGSSFRHLRLTKPGLKTLALGQGHTAFTFLKVGPIGGAGTPANGDTITLRDSANVEYIFEIDNDLMVNPGNLQVFLGGAGTDQQAAESLAASINATTAFRAVLDPSRPGVVIVWQLASGTNGNRSIACSGTYNYLEYAYTTSALPGVAEFFGGAAAAGLEYTWKSSVPAPVRLKFISPSSVYLPDDNDGFEYNSARGQYEVVDYATSGGLALPQVARRSLWELNHLLSHSTDGVGPLAWIEPASTDRWSLDDSSKPTLSLAQIIHSEDDWSDQVLDEAAGVEVKINDVSSSTTYTFGLTINAELYEVEVTTDGSATTSELAALLEAKINTDLSDYFWATSSGSTLRVSEKTGVYPITVTFDGDHSVSFVEGEIVIPAADIRVYPIFDKLVGAFRPTHTAGISLTSRDRGEAQITRLADQIQVALPIDFGTVAVGRNPSSEVEAAFRDIFQEINASLVDLYAGDRGYEHAPDDILSLHVDPRDAGHYNDPDTDWCWIPSAEGSGVNDEGDTPTQSGVFYEWDGSSITGTTGLTLTPVIPRHLVTLQYRTAGVIGNTLGVRFLQNPNAGQPQDFSINSDDTELTVQLNTGIVGQLTGTTLEELADRLHELDLENGEPVYPIEIVEVLDLTNGQIVSEENWGAINIEPCGFAELASYLLTNNTVQTSKLFAGPSIQFKNGSAGAVVRLDETMRGIGSSGAISLFADYQALRTDFSPIASFSVHGREPNLVRLQASDYEELLGDTTEQNPLGLAAKLYFRNGGPTCYVIAVDEVSDTEPWGTREAVSRAMELASRRLGYHHVILNDASWVVPDAFEFCENLGGVYDTETGEATALVKPMLVYVPVKAPEVGPDMVQVEGDGLTLLSDSVSGTIVNTGVNMIEAGIQVGDVLVSVTYPGAGNFRLQDGRDGFKVLGTYAGQPTRLLLQGTSLPSGIFDDNGGTFEVVRPGQNLRTSNGTYNSSVAYQAMIDYHKLYQHRRLIKHMSGQFSELIDGVRQTLDGVYLLAMYAALVARRTFYLPTNSELYSATVQSLQGTSSQFSEEHIRQLAGVGLTIAVQDGGSSTAPVRVHRDVSSDVSTKVKQRRGATVTDDVLSLRIDRRVLPGLTGALITQEFLDALAADTDAILEGLRSLRCYKTLEIESIQLLDDALRARYNVQDTGLLVLISRQHLEEPGAVIFHHLVRPS